MGCNESVPIASEFHAVHRVNPKLPALGEGHNAGPSLTGPTKLIVREKLFSWSGDSFKIKTLGGDIFGNKLHVRGKAFALRDQMVLENGNGEPVAICLRKFEPIGQTFKIYLPQPVYPGQIPSKQNFQHHKLYTYCQVQRKPLTTEQQVILEGKSQPEYTINRAGSLWPKKRVVKRRGRPAALMEGGTWEGNWNSYLLTINPGIDPCFIICLAAICDEMDEDISSSSGGTFLEALFLGD
jgi:hypothetical protein